MINNPNKPKRTSEERAGLALAGSLGVESLSTGRAVQVLRGKKLKPLPVIGDKGEVALQATNLGVGAYAASKLLRQKAKDNGAVMKNDQSMISKASGDVSISGHGRSLVEVSKSNNNLAANIGIGTGATLAAGGAGFAGLGHLATKNTKKELKRAENTKYIPHSIEDYEWLKNTKKSLKRDIKHLKIARGTGAAIAAGGGGLALVSQKYKKVEKAYRRFDPEADRQRRAGLYTGLGVLGAGLAGREAANHFTTRAKTAEGKTVRGVVAKPRKGKLGLGLAAVAGASGAFGAHSYKSGLSARNQPWT